MTEVTDIAIDRNLLDEAESLGLDVSQLLNNELRRQIDKGRRAAAWREENREAIKAWNEEIDGNGLWYERLSPG
jgi:post-segregation antitoxin (ccd killing protein)